MPSGEGDNEYLVWQGKYPYVFRDVDSLYHKDIPVVNVPESDLPSFYEDVKAKFFLPTRDALELLGKKLDEFEMPPGFFKGYYSLHAKTTSETERYDIYLIKRKTPQQISVNDQVVGSEAGSLTMSDKGYHEVSLHFLEDGRVAFTDDHEDIGTILDTPKSLVRPLAQKHRFGGVGNAATWIVKLIHTGTIIAVTKQLESLPDKR